MAELNAPALIRDDTFTIYVRFISTNSSPSDPSLTYDPDNLAINILSPKEYLYVSTIPVQPEELVVVPARGVPTVAVVTKVDDTVDIPPNHERKIGWVIAKIDMEIFYENLRKNKKLNTLIQQAYVKNAKASFRNMLLGGMNDEARLQITEILGG